LWSLGRQSALLPLARCALSPQPAAAALFNPLPTHHNKQTIYEIPGAEEVAIETCSFSKYAGFTGVRLGWTVVPKALKYADGSLVHTDWNRMMTTCFNGASNIAQAGGLASVQPEGFREMMGLVAFYKENAAILKACFQDMGFKARARARARPPPPPPCSARAALRAARRPLPHRTLTARRPARETKHTRTQVYGGSDAPYVWVGFPGKASWDVFAEILEKCNIVTTPGSGFGPGGEGFVRASAFGSRADIQEAVRRFQGAFGKK